MKIIKLSVQDFALPAPRRGSIEPSSGLYTSLQKGTELHQKVQALRKEEFPEYESEVSLSCSFIKDGYQFEVSGRIDGYRPGTKPRIEEIKSSFNIFDLSKKHKRKKI